MVRDTTWCRLLLTLATVLRADYLHVRAARGLRTCGIASTAGPDSWFRIETQARTRVRSRITAPCRVTDSQTTDYTSG